MKVRLVVAAALAMLALVGCTDTDFSPDIISRPTVGVQFDPAAVECGPSETDRAIWN